MEHTLEIKLVVFGLKISEPYKGDLFSLERCEVNCYGTNLSHCVQFDCGVTVEAAPSLSEQEYVNQVLEQELDL